MRAIVFASMLLASTVANQVTFEDPSYSFDHFVGQFRLSFPEQEISMRKALFEAELARVREHNKKNLGWKETVNKYSAWTSAEKKKSSFGRNKNMARHHGDNLKSQQSLPADFTLKPVHSLPKSVDWRDKGVISAVKDQGHCGSCWAFASTATIESHVALATGQLYDLSVQQMAMCAPNPNACGGTGGCEGSTAELAFDYLSGVKGFYEEYQYGYVSYFGTDVDCKTSPGPTKPKASINGYVQLPTNNYTAVMNAVAQVGPVAINIDASTWHAYSSGIYSGCDATPTSDINHVVVLIGYGEEADGSKYWLVRNSWSASWGENGYVRLARSDNDASQCQTDNTPQDGVACSGQTDPVQVCGQCGVIYDVSYPTNAKLV